MNGTNVPDIDSKFLEPKIHLGRGTFGQVFKTIYRGEAVAMKVLENDSPECRKQFLNEAPIAQIYPLHHPNIIKVIGKCSCNTKLAFIMELMDDGSVDDLVHVRLNLAYKADHVFSWARQCADAVSFIHERNFVYRDLKPTNLLLKDGYRVLKLCDFGTVATVKTSMTNNQGTPSWMAPEVFKSRKYDAKCDVYSFGITLWELLTRKRPFRRNWDPYLILWKASDGHRPSTITDENFPKLVMDLITEWVSANTHFERCTNTCEIEVFPNRDDPLIDTSEERGNLEENATLSNQEIVEPSIFENDNLYMAYDADINFLNSLDPSLRPIAPKDSLQAGANDLYSKQVYASRQLYNITQELQKNYQIKHDLIAQLNNMVETGKLIDKLDSLRAQLQASNARICQSKQMLDVPR